MRSRLAKLGGLCLFLVIVSVSLWFVYSPDHWLERVDYGRVSIDGRQVPADIYFGHPTFDEAEVIALVHVAGAGDYFLDFSGEKVRVGNRSEYLRLFDGAWCYRPMREGRFIEPLPFQNLNEFRIASPTGHILSVQF
jgi:hypothetical protein